MLSASVCRAKADLDNSSVMREWVRRRASVTSVEAETTLLGLDLVWLWGLFRRLCWRRGECGVGWGAAAVVGEDVPDKTGDAGWWAE